VSTKRRVLSQRLAKPALFLGVIATAMVGVWALSGGAGGARLNALADRFGFDPSRFFAAVGENGDLGSRPSLIDQIVTLFTYAFIHVSALHVYSNVLTLFVFGAPVALRLKDAWRVLVLLAVGSAGGALLFGAFHLKDGSVLVGASGAVSALVGAYIRFGFRRDAFAERPSAISPLFGRDTAFWSATIIVLMIEFARFDPHLSGPYARVAFEAHIGGFIAGALAMSALDRRQG
jgi:membrane associated rhomboid family serine protease